VDFPEIIAAADWSVNANKRWLAVARRIDGKNGTAQYLIKDIRRVDEPSTLLSDLQAVAGNKGTVFLGLDLPIGIPLPYAKRIRVKSFRQFIQRVQTSKRWTNFFEPTLTPSVYTPFFPARSGVVPEPKKHLAFELGLDSTSDLYRWCDRAQPGRRAAESLFFTAGQKQVGKAAISAWRDVLLPNIDSINLWPFDGPLDTLLKYSSPTVAEIYPSDSLRVLLPEFQTFSKQKLESRKKAGEKLLEIVTSDEQMYLDKPMHNLVKNGFPNEDAFDAFLGLLHMLWVVLGRHKEGCPPSEEARLIEGGILGRKRIYPL
jgi:hypothetical protein